MNILIWLGIIILIIILVISLDNRIIIKNYKVISNKLKKDSSFRIVLITDLHSHIFGKDQSKLIEMIKSQNPDIIALAGDIIDDKEHVKGAELLLSGIKDICPIYFATGNHEFRTGDIKSKVFPILEKYQVKMLLDSFDEILINNQKIIIAGINDPDGIKKYDFGLTLKEVNNKFFEIKDNDAFTILLAHRPELIELYQSYGFDLVMSGHAHGGQVRIPYLVNGLFAPHQGVLPKYAGGIYQHTNLTHIVSRGLSFNLFRPRIFNRPELVVINIKSK